VDGRWQWYLHSSQKYSISSAYNYLTTSKNVTTEDSSHIIWHKVAPLKISLFLLGFFFRIAFLHPITYYSRDLFKINNIYVCVVATLTRILIIYFLHCYFFGTIWSLNSHWLGCDTMNPSHISDHLLQFGHLGGTSKHHQLTMNLLWLACSWGGPRMKEMVEFSSTRSTL